MAQGLGHAQGLVDYIYKSPTPYHAVANSKRHLVEHGYIELDERDLWSSKLSPRGKYFVTRNASSLIAFRVGHELNGKSGIAMVGAHTDSPCLRIKPVSKRSSHGFIQVGVEQYGGLIAHSWFDRDLLIAGRVYVRQNGEFVPKLVHIDRPLLRIPTLAIHLDRDQNSKFEFNMEMKLLPIAGQNSMEKEAKNKLQVNENRVGSERISSNATNVADKRGLNNEAELLNEEFTCCNDPSLQVSPIQFESILLNIIRHNESLINVIAKELNVLPTDIEDFELVLCDHQKPIIGGLHLEFIFSPRLDNLTSCYAGIHGLVNAPETLDISLLSLFDHEEIGSVSAQGADSSFLPDTLDRLCNALKLDHHATMARSFLVSSDMAHGVHPNYSEKYEAMNQPHLNAGPVIKINANQRYATNSLGIVLVKQVANMANIPLQLFVVRNDSPCGLTIGPLLLAKLGIRTLDLGNPQLSMHSIREICGTQDVSRLVDLFACYYGFYGELNMKIK